MAFCCLMIDFQKKIFQEYQMSAKQGLILYQVRYFIVPGLGPNCSHC